MCTGIFIKTKDGKFIFARTLEFGVYLKWKQFCSLNIKGTIGHFDNVKEGFMTDGLNSNGLFVGTFFFPHNDKQYPKKEDPNKINLETGDVNLYLLQNFFLKVVAPKIACKLLFFLTSIICRLVFLQISKVL